MLSHLGGWRVHTQDDGRHVIPVDDLRPHDPSQSCWCRPYLDADDDRVIVHNSMDGREMIECSIRAVQ